MNEVIGRVVSFEKQTFPDARALYNKLATDGQSPKALMISCADSRIVPEHIVQAAPGDLFVCRTCLFNDSTIFTEPAFWWKGTRLKKQPCLQMTNY